jgi:hypothetical protein
MQTGSATSIAALLVLIMFYSGNAASNSKENFPTTTHRAHRI